MTAPRTLPRLRQGFIFALICAFLIFVSSAWVWDWVKGNSCWLRKSDKSTPCLALRQGRASLFRLLSLRRTIAEWQEKSEGR
jgi:hypothetical protein